MSSSTEAAICPGQAASFQRAEDASPLLRLVFQVYWLNAMPCAEVFYAESVLLTPNGIATMIETALKNLNAARALDAEYLGYSGIEVTPAEMAAFAPRTLVWPTPVWPTFPVVAPAPAPAPDPVPDPMPMPMPVVVEPVEPPAATSPAV
jgi:hypothetical protein